MAASYKDLTYEAKGRVVTITMNRPDKLNALSRNSYEELRHAVVRADIDEKVDVVVLTGAGRAFSSGGDLSEVNELHGEDARIDLAAHAAMAQATYQQLLDMRKPVVARVNGLAHAGGFHLVLNSDVAICVETATFRMPMGLRGLASPTGPQLMQAIGVARAKWLLLTAAEISAAEALDWGIVAQVVPATQLDVAADEAVEMLLRIQPLAREYTKAALNRAFYPAELSILARTLASPEAATGTTQFASKGS
jgi:enoyl-CoA hydratase